VFKKLFIIVMGILFCSLFCLHNVYSEVTKSTASGQIQLKETGSFDKSNPKGSLGKIIQLDYELYIDDFFGKKCITTNPHISNTTSKAIYIAFHVAFFDDDKNLIACVSQKADVKSNSPDFGLGSSFVTLPHSEISKVTYYQAVLYESEEKIGKE